VGTQARPDPDCPFWDLAWEVREAVAPSRACSGTARSAHVAAFSVETIPPRGRDLPDTARFVLRLTALLQVRERREQLASRTKAATRRDSVVAGQQLGTDLRKQLCRQSRCLSRSTMEELQDRDLEGLEIGHLDGLERRVQIAGLLRA